MLVFPKNAEKNTSIIEKGLSTGMAAQMQLEVILAGNRLATRVL